ncbi:Rrf2 family transcriptional regulator [Cytophagaceae bacterium ABcell3]|nr:Rrf2 family transcriptional regulator [Cytophagaceae bacterium ABcell3]
MLMLSKSCEYGMRAVVYIALNSSKDHKVGIKDIAESLEFPAPFLAKILQSLVKHKLIASTKGPNGGFFLEKKPEKISMLNIMEAIDGLAYFKECGMGFKKCSDKRPCPLHDSFKVYRDNIKLAFSMRTLDVIINEINDNKVFIHK